MAISNPPPKAKPLITLMTGFTPASIKSHSSDKDDPETGTALIF